MDTSSKYAFEFVFFDVMFGKSICKFMISSSKLLHLDGLMKIERDDLLKILS